MKISNNIKSTIRIAKIELNSMFYSPVAWLILLIFVCQIGFSFSGSFDKILHAHDQGQTLWQITSKIFSGMFGILSPILRNLYLYIPLITMGLMSREYQTGSIKLLYSSPIKNSSIILGKFLSMMVYGFILLGILIFITIFSTLFIKDFDYGMLLASLLGFYLLILAYSAIGIFMSSLTQYQVVAALGTLALLAGLNFVGEIGQNYDFVRDVTYWISISGRTYPYLEGLIASDDTIYFIVVIAFFLSLAAFKLNTEKTIMSTTKKIMGYSSIVLLTVIAGYFTSRPEFKYYYDATSNKSNTLSPESQRIIKEVKQQKGDIKIISYVNILAEEYYCGLPSRRIADRRRFDKYIRFMPGIEMEYVLYYDKTIAPSFTASRFERSSLKETAELVSKSNKIDFDKVLSPEEFKEKYRDLKSEGNKFIRILQTKDGNEYILRIFNDNDKHPNEAEISAAFTSFIAKPQIVGFYSNNEARALDNYGDRGFYLFGYDKWFRNSLPNHGFKTKTVDLESDDLNDLDVLVISDLVTPLSDAAMANVVNYYEKGGNMFISGDYRRSANMNKLTKMLGVEFSEGVLVEPNPYRNPTILAARFTKEAAEKYYAYYKLQKYNYSVSTNAATAIDCTKSVDMGFDVTTVLKSKPETWLEYETTDFIDGVFEFNEKAGEVKKEYDIISTLERKVGDKSQRIVVSGDCDIIGNGELTAKHASMSSSNYSIIQGSFRWLSNDIYPVDVRIADMTDDEIFLPTGLRKYVKGLFMVVIPFILLTLGIFIIVRRQRK